VAEVIAKRKGGIVEDVMRRAERDALALVIRHEAAIGALAGS
jgi:hypothetical protein